MNNELSFTLADEKELRAYYQYLTDKRDSRLGSSSGRVRDEIINELQRAHTLQELVVWLKGLDFHDLTAKLLEEYMHELGIEAEEVCKHSPPVSMSQQRRFAVQCKNCDKVEA